MEWRKSSHSNEYGECVELAGTLDRVRDSKNPAEPIIVDITPFLSWIKRGQFDGPGI